MNNIYTTLLPLWNQLYSFDNETLLSDFCDHLSDVKMNVIFHKNDDLWYKNVVVYSLYVDKFNDNFAGLIDKLDYLQHLGINCIWLLPILQSPMRDAGFDISNFRCVRKSLFGLDENVDDNVAVNLFQDFVNEAHARNIRIIFDVAFNHCSESHPWFVDAKNNGKYRDYFIWSDTDEKYSGARVIFKGICDSNWTKCGAQYYFHRFFEFQPDLNYKNPKVLLEMIDNLIFWLSIGVDGFRADAIPYLWKEDDTDCENLDGTHTILKIIRSVLNYLCPNTLLLAEACQKHYEVVKYISGNECNGGYHFPLMPMIYKSLALQSSEPIKNILSKNVTPDISADSQWFIFLRCHDELSLEDVYVSDADRKIIYNAYCKNPLWDFRKGEGISSRLSNLMDMDADKILLAFSILLSLPGTPIIYYGDEFGMANDEDSYREEIARTGKNDTRFLVRGKIDWNNVEKSLTDENSFNGKVYKGVKSLLSMRNANMCFSNGILEWIDCGNDGVLSYYIKNSVDKLLIVNNLMDESANVEIGGIKIELEKFESRWIFLD